MNARLDSGLLILSLALVVGGVQRTQRLLNGELTQTMTSPSSRLKPPVLPSVDSLGDAAATIVANDPFRLSNAPSTVRYMATPNPAAPIAIVRPTFIVRAIIGGPPWSALLEGIPGQNGPVIVSPGSTYGKLRIRSIVRDTVVVQAPDTTWKLTMKTSS